MWDFSECVIVIVIVIVNPEPRVRQPPSCRDGLWIYRTLCVFPKHQDVKSSGVPTRREKTTERRENREPCLVLGVPSALDQPAAK